MQGNTGNAWNTGNIGNVGARNAGKVGTWEWWGPMQGITQGNAEYVDT